MMKTIELDDIRAAVAEHSAAPIGRYRYSSVLLPLVPLDGELHILYEVRAKTLKAQPGEISFPGGRIEEGEDRLTAALRETSEELGLPIDGIEAIAELDYIGSHDSTNIYCFLGFITEEGFQRINANPAEVDELFTVPLSFFLENEPEVYTNRVTMEVDPRFPYARVGIDEHYPWRSSLHPVLVYDYFDKSTGKSHAIWGLTAMMTKSFIDLLREKPVAGSKTAY